MTPCSYCGHQNADANRFCTCCGSSLARDDLTARLLLLQETPSRVYLVAEAERFVGRDITNDLVLDDEQVSNRHMRFARREGAFWAEDLGSKNGVYVNGERIREARKLEDGDLVKVGGTMLRFSL